MNINISDIEVFAESLDVKQAAAIYQEHGCLVVRGLMKPYIEAIAREVEQVADTARSLYDQAKEVPGIGWTTPDGTLWIKAPGSYNRDKQIMVLGLRYTTSGAFLQSAVDKNAVDLVEAVLGPNIELFLDGQCLYKEPVGGHPKNLHQDSAYFEHRYDGPMASLNYVVDTDLVNGALHVVPGSHKLGQLTHIDTFSHLGLDPDEWPWEKSLPICGKAGDAIFFHYRCIHGSKENHSEKPRPVFIHRYRRPDDYVTISAATAAAREEAEKHAAEVKKQNQQGLMVRGVRLWEPPT
ncbi:phytanoyl-CoA dioxygenase family protein [Armatimonas sp.]|uniref:phytanoyl-CoA dioxygenase family protein n=1 Tax=Armatimonas sp. TaxID=1872638 RepID=UPI00286C7E1E|nr:phytanoyl-CoA dioxygenase family protein [Armatimonas sp.]